MSFSSWLVSQLLLGVLLAASGKGTAGVSGASSATKTAAPPRSAGGSTGASATAPSGSAATSGSAAGRNDPTRTSTEPADASAPPTYAREIAPLFELRCVKCHGSPFARNDLRLTSYANAMRGGETGTAVIPGDPEGSLLLKKVEGRDKPSMPPRKPLAKAEKELLRRWIAAGAPP